jgi:3-deoxy-D-manno-octulosonic acid kinase
MSITTAFDVQVLQFKGGAVCFDASRISGADATLFVPGSSKYSQVDPVSQGGRRAAWFVEGAFGQAVLRHYRRGGLMARLSRNRYFWTGGSRTRSFAEFELLRFMHERGLPVPRPLAAAWWRSGFTYRAAILIERIAGARALVQCLDEGHHAEVALAIFRMHQAGVWHADLNAYNILIDPHNKAWLIDFDKSRFRSLTPELRQANLRRLRRSLIKLAGERGLQWWNELDQAYERLERSQGHL